MDDKEVVRGNQFASEVMLAQLYALWLDGRPDRKSWLHQNSLQLEETIARSFHMSSEARDAACESVKRVMREAFRAERRGVVRDLQTSEAGSDGP